MYRQQEDSGEISGPSALGDVYYFARLQMEKMMTVQILPLKHLEGHHGRLNKHMPWMTY